MIQERCRFLDPALMVILAASHGRTANPPRRIPCILRESNQFPCTMDIPPNHEGEACLELSLGIVSPE